MRHLLDTNIVSDLVRNPRAAWHGASLRLAKRRSAPASSWRQNCATGQRRGDRHAFSAQLEVVLGALDVLPFEAPADAAYGALRSRLEQLGTPIGGNDLLIAAQAIALGCAIVTDNEREFARIDDLPCENWLRQA